MDFALSFQESKGSQETWYVIFIDVLLFYLGRLSAIFRAKITIMKVTRQILKVVITTIKMKSLVSPALITSS